MLSKKTVTIAKMSVETGHKHLENLVTEIDQNIIYKRSKEKGGGDKNQESDQRCSEIIKWVLKRTQ